MRNFKELKAEMMEIAQSISENNNVTREIAISISNDIAKIVKVSGVPFFTSTLWTDKIIPSGDNYGCSEEFFGILFSKNGVFMKSTYSDGDNQWSELGGEYVNETAITYLKIVYVEQILEHLPESLEMYYEEMKRRHGRTLAIHNYLKKLQ